VPRSRASCAHPDSVGHVHHTLGSGVRTPRHLRCGPVARRRGLRLLKSPCAALTQAAVPSLATRCRLLTPRALRACSWDHLAALRAPLGRRLLVLSSVAAKQAEPSPPGTPRRAAAAIGRAAVELAVHSFPSISYHVCTYPAPSSTQLGHRRPPRPHRRRPTACRSGCAGAVCCRPPRRRRPT
jgi:hypothetical protein